MDGRNSIYGLMGLVSTVPLDKNASEAALGVVALMRGNALFVGHDWSGGNHAILLTLAATARLHGVNPEACLVEVLLRVQSHPAAQLDELLPHNWRNLFGEAWPDSLRHQARQRAGAAPGRKDALHTANPSWPRGTRL